MTAGANPDPRRSRVSGSTDPSIRRTWWLLSATFLILGVFALIRFLGSRNWVDLGIFLVILVAALAAIGHRNAVAGLEARGRAEAESFARILRGLSRSVSADAIVAAIMDDLLDATDADHVVVVRRRADNSALEATLVTRRAGVPTTTTTLPIIDLDAPIEWTPAATIVPVGPGINPVETAPAIPVEDRRGRTGVEEPVSAPSDGDHPLVRREPAPGRDAIPGPFSSPGAPALTIRPALASARVAGANAAFAESGAERARRMASTAISETVALIGDLGVPLPRRRPDGTGPSQAEVIGSGLDAAIAARVAGRVRGLFGLSQTLSTALRTDQGLIGAIVLSRRDRERWSESSRRLLRGAAIEASSALARADSQREAESQAATDALTGLPNRRYFDEFCSLLGRRRRAGDAVSVLMIDIDKFKVLNDTYGHPIGDEVLKAVGSAILSTVREQDVPARVGGEEFAVLLRNPGPNISLEVGERVREAVRALDLHEHGVPGVSVSVGVADALGPEEPIADIVSRADHALLRAKRGGRDRVVAA
ncbi:MAG TPA: diguanylate cyclase [Candidatus Limnocylindrales bacterium]|nr:diguanylate cyclase [Candidatus Limnocylindrales bacterium]